MLRLEGAHDGHLAKNRGRSLILSSLGRRIEVCYKRIQEHVHTDLNAITLACWDSIIGGIAATLLFHWLVDIFLRALSARAFQRRCSNGVICRSRTQQPLGDDFDSAEVPGPASGRYIKGVGAIHLVRMYREPVIAISPGNIPGAGVGSG